VQRELADNIESLITYLILARFTRVPLLAGPCDPLVTRLLIVSHTQRSGKHCDLAVVLQYVFYAMTAGAERPIASPDNGGVEHQARLVPQQSAASPEEQVQQPLYPLLWHRL
jgi:hypothetical protein